MKPLRYLTLIAIPAACLLFFLPAFGDTIDISVMQNLLREHRFSDLQEKIDYLADKTPADENGRNTVSQFISKIISADSAGEEGEERVDETLLDHINAWCKESPQNWLSLAVRGNFYMCKAQGDLTRKEANLTGSNIKSNTANALGMFKKARRDFNQAMEINPQNAGIYALLIKLSRLTGDELAQAQELYAKGSAIEPGNFELNLQMLKKYAAGWGGDPNDEMLAFARKTAADNPRSPILELLICYAHREIAEYSDNPESYYASSTVWDEISGIYLNLAEKYPDSELLINELSEFAYRAGRIESLKWEPKYGDFYFWLGKRREDENNFHAAIENYTRAIEQKEWRKAFLNIKAGALYRRANLLLAYRDNPAGALADIEAAIKINPATMDFYVLRSRTKEMMEKCDEALSDIALAISGEPSRPDFYNQRGLLYFKMKRYPKAVDDFNNAINLAPEKGIFYLNRGLVKINQKYPDEDSAWEDFQSALIFDPTLADAYYNIALIMESKDDFGEAEKYYTKTIELNSDHMPAHLKRAQLFERRGKFQKALDSYNKIIEKNDRDPSLYFRRGILLWKKLDNIAAAQNDLIKAAGLMPSRHNYIESLVLLGDEIALIRRDYKRSLDIYDEAIKLAPNHSWAYNGKAWVLVTINSPHKNIREGIKLAQKSLLLLDKEPFKDSIRYSQALDTLARAWTEIGDLNKAIGYAKKAVALNPLNTENTNSLHVLWMRWWKKVIFFWLKIAALFFLASFIVKRWKKQKKDPWNEE